MNPVSGIERVAGNVFGYLQCGISGAFLSPDKNA
jgi:hypothetical protein